MSLKTVISAKIKGLYDYHEYQISKENLIKLSESFFEIKPDLDLLTFDNFIKAVSLGKYGILYKMPTCILSMFNKFVSENIKRIP